LLAPVGPATPVLIVDVATGKHFPTAVFKAAWGAGGSTASLTYELDDVVVESIQHSGSSEAAIDSISLAFRKATWTYTDANGSVTRGFDIGSNMQT
jgi:type VI protein secretion system component Hcp